MPRRREPDCPRVVYRTARAGLRLTKARRRRLLALLVAVARGCPPLRVRGERGRPCRPGQVRWVTLLCDGGGLWADVTAEVPVTASLAGREPDPGRVAGVDLGIIPPYAVAGPGADG